MTYIKKIEHLERNGYKVVQDMNTGRIALYRRFFHGIYTSINSAHLDIFGY